MSDRWKVENEGYQRADWVRLYRRRRDIERIRELESEVWQLEQKVMKLERSAREGESMKSSVELSESLYGMMINQQDLEIRELRETITKLNGG